MRWRSMKASEDIRLPGSKRIISHRKGFSAQGPYGELIHPAILAFVTVNQVFAVVGSAATPGLAKSKYSLNHSFSLAFSLCSICSVVETTFFFQFHFRRNSSGAKDAAMGLPRANVTKVRPSWMVLSKGLENASRVGSELTSHPALGEYVYPGRITGLQQPREPARDRYRRRQQADCASVNRCNR